MQTAINRSSGYTTIGGEQRLVWKPDLERIERVVVKNARGHAFFEIGDPPAGLRAREYRLRGRLGPVIAAALAWLPFAVARRRWGVILLFVVFAAVGAAIAR